MCKGKGLKNVTLRKAIECVVNAYLNDDIVKIKVYDSMYGDKINEITFYDSIYDSNYKDMDIAINIMDFINSDNHRKYNNAKFINNVKKVKAETVTVLPAFTDDIIQDIALSVADNVTKELLATYNAHKDDLDDKYKEVPSDDIALAENILVDHEDDDYYVLFNNIMRELYTISTVIPDIKDFDPNTNVSCMNKYNDESYVCISSKLMDKLVEDCNNEMTKKEILTNFDRLGLLHHQKNKLTVTVKGTTMHALKAINNKEIN